jgi:hypothetical protein
MYIPAAVGPDLKPVTCCREDVRAVARLAKANDAARVERKRMFAVSISKLFNVAKKCALQTSGQRRDLNL